MVDLSCSVNYLCYLSCVCVRACLPCATASVWSPWWTRTCRARSSVCLSSWSTAADRSGARTAGCLCSGTAWSVDCPHHPRSDKSCTEFHKYAPEPKETSKHTHKAGTALQHAESFTLKPPWSGESLRKLSVSHLQWSKSDMTWAALPASRCYISTFFTYKNDSTHTTSKVLARKVYRHCMI